MANLQIIDTGHITATNVSDTQAPTIANSGTAISLRGVSLSYQRGANVNSNEIINSNSSPVVGFGSTMAAKITIQGVLDSNNTSDMDLMDDINDLVKTYGVKLLSYSDTTDGYRDITDSIGYANRNDVHKDNNYSGTATPHLHVRITNFQITQTANSYLRYTLEMVETE